MIQSDKYMHTYQHIAFQGDLKKCQSKYLIKSTELLQNIHGNFRFLLQSKIIFQLTRLSVRISVSTLSVRKKVNIS